MATDPHKPQDITAQMASQIQPLSWADMADLDPGAFAGAENTTYLGENTEAESKDLLNRHFTVTRQTDYLLHIVADDPRFGYKGKASAVVRHAVQLLMQYYVANAAMIDDKHGYASEVLRSQEDVRLAAYRVKVRKEFREQIGAFDEEMAEALRIGDYAYIFGQLSLYSAMLKGCASAAQKNVLSESFLRSIETRSAASAFYDFVATAIGQGLDHSEIPEWNRDEWQKIAVTWNGFFEDNPQ